MVAPLPRRVTPVIRRAVDDLVEPAAGETQGDAVTLAAATVPAAPEAPSALDDAAVLVARRTPDEWRPR
jgi:hypothetical protein